VGTTSGTSTKYTKIANAKIGRNVTMVFACEGIGVKMEVWVSTKEPLFSQGRIGIAIGASCVYLAILIVGYIKITLPRIDNPGQRYRRSSVPVWCKGAYVLAIVGCVLTIVGVSHSGTLVDLYDDTFFWAAIVGPVFVGLSIPMAGAVVIDVDKNTYTKKLYFFVALSKITQKIDMNNIEEFRLDNRFPLELKAIDKQGKSVKVSKTTDLHSFVQILNTILGKATKTTDYDDKKQNDRKMEEPNRVRSLRRFASEEEGKEGEGEEGEERKEGDEEEEGDVYELKKPKVRATTEYERRKELFSNDYTPKEADKKTTTMKLTTTMELTTRRKSDSTRSSTKQMSFAFLQDLMFDVSQSEKAAVLSLFYTKPELVNAVYSDVSDEILLKATLINMSRAELSKNNTDRTDTKVARSIEIDIGGTL